MNVLFTMNKFLAEIMNKITDYNVEITETHHTKKLDKPSGTAITLAEQIIENLDRKSDWSLEKENDETIKIDSIREGDVFGIHEVKYESSFDEINIYHSAKSRKGFALGAVLAAEFLANKKDVYEMQDVLKELLSL